MTGRDVGGPGADVPRLFVLTDARASVAAGRSLVDTVRLVVAAGAPAIVLREKELPKARRHALARELADVTAGTDTRLLVASDAELAASVGAHGVHLAARDEAVARAGRWSVGKAMVGRSCHDDAEIRTACRDDVDYLTVSPVAPTLSKPGYGPPLGLDGLAAAVRLAGARPVVALGGVTPGNAAAFVAAGAHGVAVMGEVMRARDPAAVIGALLEHLTEVSR